MFWLSFGVFFKSNLKQNKLIQILHTICSKLESKIIFFYNHTYQYLPVCLFKRPLCFYLIFSDKINTKLSSPKNSLFDFLYLF
jgi:hypothetical protein